jgi:HK97 gp10 family phage protein
MARKAGGTSLQANLTVPNFEKYLAKIRDAGNDIDDACRYAIDSATPIIGEEMKSGAHRHRKTGKVEDAIEIVPAKQEGNYIYGHVGIDIKKHPEAIHGVYQEFGDGHSPGFPDPFIRPAVDNNKKEVKAVMRKKLKERGVPID